MVKSINKRYTQFRVNCKRKKEVEIKYKDENGNVEIAKFKADTVDENGTTNYKYGFSLINQNKEDFFHQLNMHLLKQLN